MDNEVCSKLKGEEAFVVPPEIDVPRKLKFAIVSKIDDYKFEFSVQENMSYEVLVGKNLLISDKVAKDIFTKLPLKTGDVIGKIIIDSNLGKIGKVKDVAGTSAQKHLVVEYKGDEVLVPYVKEFIKEENGNEIIMDLPAGMIEVNKD
ncbi:MAG: hypothetical protein Q4F54_03825 [Coriobacteriia bacterium]|nr:hypothetical protein [Coriobacteriia bacterium]